MRFAVLFVRACADMMDIIIKGVVSVSCRCAVRTREPDAAGAALEA